MRDKNPHYWEQEDKVDEQGRGRAQLACRKPRICFLPIFKIILWSPQHFLLPTPPWALSLRGENAWWPPVRSRSLSPPSSWSLFQTIFNNFKTLKPSKLSTTLKTFLMSSPPHKAPVGTYKACFVAADLRKIKMLPKKFKPTSDPFQELAPPEQRGTQSWSRPPQSRIFDKKNNIEILTSRNLAPNSLVTSGWATSTMRSGSPLSHWLRSPRMRWSGRSATGLRFQTQTSSRPSLSSTSFARYLPKTQC